MERRNTPRIKYRARGLKRLKFMSQSRKEKQIVYRTISLKQLWITTIKVSTNSWTTKVTLFWIPTISHRTQILITWVLALSVSHSHMEEQSGSSLNGCNLMIGKFKGQGAQRDIEVTGYCLEIHFQGLQSVEWAICNTKCLPIIFPLVGQQSTSWSEHNNLKTYLLKLKCRWVRVKKGTSRPREILARWWPKTQGKRPQVEWTRTWHLTPATISTKTS
jgi:hypothetical protein